MIKFIDVTGKTEDEAISRALAQLGLDRDDVSVEILERAKSGFLGLGGQPATVRVSYDDGVSEVKEEEVKVAAPKQEEKKAGKIVFQPEVLQREVRAKEKAEQLLSDWIAKGDVSENSFAELAKANSKDGNAAQGGLYKDVYPGQMVAPFENWLYDAERKVGDYGIVETDFGYHIMFFVGDSDTTFRDFMITNVIRNEDMEKWHNDLMEKMTLEVLTIKHVDMDMVLGN